MKKAIFLYDFTGIMAEPWLAAGYECWLFDAQHPNGITRDGLLVKVGRRFSHDQVLAQAVSIRDTIGKGVEFVFGFPECTDLAVSGARHFAKKRAANPWFQEHAIRLARLVPTLANLYDCKWGLENPVSVMATFWRKPCFTFHPYQYGGYLPEDDVHPIHPRFIIPRDAYTKKTCIWSGNGFIKPIEKPVTLAFDYDCDKHNNRVGGKSLKTKNIRSATPRGFAQAVFEANHVG